MRDPLRRRVLHRREPVMAASLNNLACLLQAQGDLASLLDLLRRVGAVIMQSLHRQTVHKSGILHRDSDTAGSMSSALRNIRAK